MNENHFYFKRGLFDNLKRELIISKSEIKFQNTDLKSKPFLTFKKDEISSYRFGVNFYQYFLSFGREYIIDVKNVENKKMTFKFNSYFKKGLEEKHQLFIDIHSALWQNFFWDKTEKMFQEFNEGNEIDICNCKLNKQGICFNNILIRWEDAKIKDYQLHFVIYSKQKPLKENTTKYYLTDWNAEILNSLVKTIIKNISEF